MYKFIAIGDVHADYPLLWEALRAASCMDAEFMPTAPVRSGVFQVVLIGDLVHPKNQLAYERLTSLSPFDAANPEHLQVAAREQVAALEKLRAYQAAAPHAIHIILGNHDANVLEPSHLLGTSGGLKHIEFDPNRGGVYLPPELSRWMLGFLRELRVGQVQFAHVSPLPAHHHYDDLFYSDRSSKTWFQDTPEYVEMAGLTLGIYGHTQMEDGIYLHRNQEGQVDFAIIDALHSRQYLELMYQPGRTPEEASKVLSVNSVLF